MPNLHYIDNETQNDPCQSDAIPQISEFNPHQFTSNSSKYYFVEVEVEIFIPSPLPFFLITCVEHSYFHTCVLHTFF